MFVAIVSDYANKRRQEPIRARTLDEAWQIARDRFSQSRHDFLIDVRPVD